LEIEKIYNEHKNLVYNLALQYVQNMEDAEEITQDVFLSIYQSIDSFREESKLSTWIYRITINKSIDLINKRNRKKRFAFLTSLFNSENDKLTHEPIHFNHPGVQLENKEALQNLFELINQLPEKQKTALIFTKIEQKSQLETAEIMELSPKAVESLLHRAKVNLQKKLQNIEGK
jgi:RNA polymerase sigma factor (sigma-70 family)